MATRLYTDGTQVQYDDEGNPLRRMGEDGRALGIMSVEQQQDYEATQWGGLKPSINSNPSLGYSITDVPGNFVIDGKTWGRMDKIPGTNQYGPDWAQGAIAQLKANGNIIERDLPGFGRLLLQDATADAHLKALAESQEDGWDKAAEMFSKTWWALPLGLAAAGGGTLAGAESVAGGSGLETIAGGAGADTLGGGVAADAITSTAGIPGLGEFVPSFLAEGGLAPGIAGLSEVTPTLATTLGEFGSGVGGGIAGIGGGGGGIPPGTTSVISRILDGTATADDWLKTLGTVGSTVLGVVGSDKQADAYRDVANQYLQIGAPYRDRLLASYQPGFDIAAADPAFSKGLGASADAAARSVSAARGNPYGNPGAMAEIQESVLNRYIAPYTSNYRGQLGQFGGLGLNTAGPASLAGASESGNMYDALGFGLGQLTTPQNDIGELLKKLAGSGGGLPGYKLGFQP